MQRGLLLDHEFQKGLITALPATDERRSGSYAAGSRNQLILGTGSARPWKGLQTKGASTGSRKMCLIGNTWGGLRDIGGVQGAGSFFQDIGKSLWFIGAGQLNMTGTDLTGLVASTTLQVAIAVAGVYDATHTYDAGLPQPSAPDVGIVSTPGAGLTGQINGPVSVKIARLRLTTGARSVASTTSAVISPSAKTVRVTFPLASTGQDNWRVFFTQQGFGGVGLSYALAYNGALDIPEATVAAGTVDGVARSLEFDYVDGNLLPEVAYIDDYPPPAGTHAARLENAMCVLGCYGDSSSAVTSTSTGTVGAVSLPNFYESYKPRFLVYFPEQVVDVMGRPTDSYCYVGHRNSITALQYVGLRDGPAVSVQMISPDVGISKACNWTQVQGQLFMRIAKGGFARMLPNGTFDYTWTNPIRTEVADWDDTTVVGWHPDTMTVVIQNGGKAFSWSLENEQWSPVAYVADAGVTGTALSCVNSRGELVVTVNNGGAHTAYSWDTGAASMPITSVVPWKRTRNGAPLTGSATLMEVALGFETDSIANPLIISAHRNLRPVYLRDCVVTNGSNQLDSAAALFKTTHTDDMVCVFGAGIGPGGLNYLLARMTYVSASRVTLLDPVTGLALNAAASGTGLYALLAYQIFSYPIPMTGEQETPRLGELLVPDAQSFALGFNLLTSATSGQVFNAQLLGTVQESGMGAVT